MTRTRTRTTTTKDAAGCPFTPEQIAEWASFGPRPRSKPETPEDLAARRSRKERTNAARKRVAAGLEGWTERAVEKELDRVCEREREPAKPSTRRRVRDHDPALDVVDHRPNGGPLLRLLWCDDDDDHDDDDHDDDDEGELRGQTLYLGGEVGSDGRVYMIPGHASRVLTVDPKTDKLRRIGPKLASNGTKFKWLRGIVVGDYVYGLPCHADEILRIHVPTGAVDKIPIPYEECYPDDPVKAREQRETIWKYHGGELCPLDGRVYAVPQSAERVLRLDPTTHEATLVGPSFPGRCKWYGGVLGRSDGAVYGVPQNAAGVLRIAPDAVTVHGDLGGHGRHAWHGGAAAADGAVVCVPANADRVLVVTPGDPAPRLELVGDADVVASGRHRDDGKYKYLGATRGADGAVYVFPSASERVLRVDGATTTTTSRAATNVGPNLRDAGMERVFQNKWQNGVACARDGRVYGMPLSGHTLLRVDPSTSPVEVTTWELPAPRRECKDKYEGGVAVASGVMYTIPNNHKAVLRIEPAEPEPEPESEPPKDRDE